MIKKIKYLLFIFVLFSFTNVYAATTGNVTYHIPNSNQLYIYDDYYVTNFSKVENGSKSDLITYFNFHEYATTLNDSTDCSNGCSYNTLYYYDHENDNLDFLQSQKLKRTDTYNSNRLAVFELYFRYTYTHIKLDTNYQLVIKLTKSKNLTWSHLDIPDDSLSIKVQDLNSFNPHEATDCVSVLNSHLEIVPDSEDTSKDSNVAYLFVNFRFNSDDWTFNHENFAFNGFKINLSKTFVNGQHYRVLGLNNYLLKNTHDSEYSFKGSKIYFFEDGQVSISGTNNGSSSGGHSSGGGRHDNLDVVHEEDVIKITDTDICGSGLDGIICHIKNLIAQIKNTFIRLGNIGSLILDGIYDFFVPSSDFIKTYTINEYHYLQNNLGILMYPLDLLISIFNRFSNISTNPVLSSSGLQIPGFEGHYIIPPFSFNLLEFFTNNSGINTIYNIYLIIVTGSLYFGFFNLCRIKFTKIFGGAS